MKYLFFIFFSILVVNLSAQETSVICADTTKTLTATGSGGATPYIYKWVTPRGDTLTSQTVQPDTSGTYVWLIKDQNGCSASGTHHVTIIPNPTSGITINANNSCLGTAQTISASGVPAGYSYSWDFGAGASPATATSPTVSVSYSSSGTKTITLTITKTENGSANGCNGTCTYVMTKNITVGSLSGGSSCN